MGNGPEGDGGVPVDVILLNREGDRFLLRADGSRLGCFRLLPAGDPGQEPLSVLVEKLIAAKAGITVSYLGVLATEPQVVVAATFADHAALPGDPTLRTLTLADVRSRGAELAHGDLFETAQRRWSAVRTAPDLGVAVQRAIDTSIAHLDSHLSVEDDHWGWSLYLDGGSVGLLSTAEAMLAHVYAGARGEFVDRPAETLEAMQNPDGGWQIRRSLVAAPSSLSITESTCSCLRALGAVGRTAANPTVAKGIAWLESTQHADGGWSPAAGDTESLVFSTITAIRTLVAFERTEAVHKGIAWLRAAQCADGGWGARAGTSEQGGSSAAYTACAIVALVEAGIPATESMVVRGRDQLRSTFRPDRDEPWESITFSALVDPVTSARMEYRHFTTPWALIALCLAGGDLGDRYVLDGLRRLLALQEPTGAWRCGLVAPGTAPVWATHDALFALRTVLRSAGRDLAPAVLHGPLTEERAAIDRLAGRVVRGGPPDRPVGSRRSWLHTAWMSVLTVGVALLFLAQFGVLRQIGSSSGSQRAGATVLSVVVTAVGAVGPPILVEEYRIRRRRRSGNPDSKDSV